MIDILAAISSIDPPSLLAWLILVCGAALYPVGIMLGANCSHCCESSYCRCLRFEAVTKDEPADEVANISSATNAPTHGYSRVVTDISQTGALNVCRIFRIPCVLALASKCRELATGEDLFFSYFIRYGKTSLRGIHEEAARWNVTVKGVTIPLSLPGSYSATVYATGTQNYIAENAICAVSESASAEVTVEACDVEILSGANYLDGSVVTKTVLLEMISATLSVIAGNRSLLLQWSSSPSMFRYLPYTATVVARYVIRHSRGDVVQYRSATITIRQGQSPLEIPSEGLSPLGFSAVTTAYVDANATLPPAIVEQSKSGQVVTASVSSAAGGTQIALKKVDSTPNGISARDDLAYSDGFTKTIPTSAYLSATITPGCLERGHIWHGLDPARTFNPFYSDGDWVYDFVHVDEFLDGIRSLEYTNEDNKRVAVALQPNNPLCGKSLCEPIFLATTPANSINMQSQLLRHAGAETLLAKSVTVRIPDDPAEFSSGESGTITANPCYEQRIRDRTIVARLGHGGDCNYLGSLTNCQQANPVIYAGASPQWFYCGDLLWAAEHGPCRETLAIATGVLNRRTVYELGGDDLANAANNAMCYSGGGLTTSAIRSPGFIDADGKCPPTEITLSVSDVSPIPASGAAIKVCEGSSVWTWNCDHAGASTGEEFPGGVDALESDFVLTGSLTCTVGGYGFSGGGVSCTVDMSRKNWCDPWVKGITVVLERNRDSIDSRFESYCGNLNLTGAMSRDTLTLKNVSADAHFDQNCKKCETKDSSGTLLHGIWNPVLFLCAPFAQHRYSASYAIEDGERSDPIDVSLAPQQTQANPAGDNVAFDFCCVGFDENREPQEVEFNVAVPANDSPQARTIVVHRGGATAYITQAPNYFTVQWAAIYTSGSNPILSIAARSVSIVSSRTRLVLSVSSEQAGCLRLSADTASEWVAIEGTTLTVFQNTTGQSRQASVTVRFGDREQIWQINQQ